MQEDCLDLGRYDERAYMAEACQVFFSTCLNIYSALNKIFVKENVAASMSDIVIDCICKVCVEDFEEIVLLAGNGYGHGALKILRGLYEKVVVAHYLHLHPQEVEKFLDYHAVKMSKFGFEEVLKKIDHDGSKINQFKASGKDGSRKRIQSSWTSVDFISMAKLSGLDSYMQVAYYLPLEYAHPSVTSILDIMEEVDGKFTVKAHEPQRGFSKHTLMLAHHFLLHVMKLQIERHGLNPDDALFEQCAQDFSRAWPG